MSSRLSKKDKKQIARLGYDVGEWLLDWVETPLVKPTLALPLGVVGPTGTGKNNLAWGVLWQCAEQGDCVVLPGGPKCDFRHFLLYSQNHELVKVKLLIPSIFAGKFELFIGKTSEASNLTHEFKKYGAEVEYYDIYQQSINDFIEPAQILVVLDACFNLESKTWFWYYNCKQLKLRKRYHYVEVTYCFPEASSYFPNTPFREQYKPTYLHSKDFIDYRGFFMRGIYLYHHSSMFWYLLEKQFETIIKKGSGYDKKTPYDNKIGRAKAIHEYTVYSQGIEDIKLKIEGMFQEIDEIWKIIPDYEQEFEYKKGENQDTKISEKDELDMILDYWLQVQDSNPKWNVEEYIIDLFLTFPEASVRMVSSISKKSREFVGKRKVDAKLMLKEAEKETKNLEVSPTPS